MKKIAILAALVLFMIQNIDAQNIDSTTIKEKRDIAKKKGDPSVLTAKKSVEDSFPNPRKAFLWSIIPGGGQIYNKKYAWIKLPIIYAGLGVGVYIINFNTNQYSRFKLAYTERLSGIQPFSDASIPQTIETVRLKQLRDLNFKNLQTAYVLTFVGYLLTGVEAFTSAHLAHFDVKDDLSLHLKPSFEPVPTQGNAVGLGIQLRF
jgi:Family of unknown function (DUF5683)